MVDVYLFHVGNLSISDQASYTVFQLHRSNIFCATFINSLKKAAMYHRKGVKSRQHPSQVFSGKVKRHKRPGKEVAVNYRMLFYNQIPIFRGYLDVRKVDKHVFPKFFVASIVGNRRVCCISCFSMTSNASSIVSHTYTVDVVSKSK